MNCQFFLGFYRYLRLIYKSEQDFLLTFILNSEFIILNFTVRSSPVF